jgi:hypothetical protein
LEKYDTSNLLKPVFKAYLALFVNAIGPMPTDKGMITYNSNGDKSGPSALALWAKNNAFVFLSRSG